jgi:hypothetical protein
MSDDVRASITHQMQHNGPVTTDIVRQIDEIGAHLTGGVLTEEEAKARAEMEHST